MTLALVTLVLMTLAAPVLMTLVAIALISGSCDTVPRDPGSATLILMAIATLELMTLADPSLWPWLL